MTPSALFFAVVIMMIAPLHTAIALSPTPTPPVALSPKKPFTFADAFHDRVYHHNDNYTASIISDHISTTTADWHHEFEPIPDGDGVLHIFPPRDTNNSNEVLVSLGEIPHGQYRMVGFMDSSNCVDHFPFAYSVTVKVWTFHAGIRNGVDPERTNLCTQVFSLGRTYVPETFKSMLVEAYEIYRVHRPTYYEWQLYDGRNYCDEKVANDNVNARGCYTANFVGWMIKPDPRRNQGGPIGHPKRPFDWKRED